MPDENTYPREYVLQVDGRLPRMKVDFDDYSLTWVVVHATRFSGFLQQYFWPQRKSEAPCDEE